MPLSREGSDDILWSIHLQILLNQLLHNSTPGEDSFLHDLQNRIHLELRE